MSADTRTAHTDAVATLGTLIDQTQKRDAIHLATEPVVAAEKLFPGQDIGLVNGLGTTNAPKLLGIVDPFLKAPVFPGERFWLIVYPRQITTLRHIWEHPDFPEQTAVAAAIMPEQQVASTQLSIAIQYITDEAEDINITYSDLMRQAADNEGADEIYTDTGRYIWPNEVFWEHYSTITGKMVSLNTYDDGCRGC